MQTVTNTRRRAALAVAAALCLAAAWRSSTSAAPAPGRWYKGNLHTHTLNSDGDSTPNEVATWYRANRYNFLVLTDHNFLTEIDGLNALHAAKEKFLLIPGEEVSDSFGGKPIHVNAFNPSAAVEPPHGKSLVETIQNNVNAIRAANALPSVNHPNFRWAFGSRELLQVKDLNLFEVYNGHPEVNNIGGGGAESLEQMWDALLTAGRRIHGVAVDDAHHFKTLGRTYSNPGRGWVMVRSTELSRAAILAALNAGDFYASTGVVLNDVAVTDTEFRVEVAPSPNSKQTTVFIGANGEALARSFENTAVYKFRGGERYVRARVEASTGDVAWTQAVFRQ
jgi:predicted metal-dependent phosphoesterase TrpH